MRTSREISDLQRSANQDYNTKMYRQPEVTINLKPTLANHISKRLTAKVKFLSPPQSVGDTGGDALAPTPTPHHT